MLMRIIAALLAGVAATEPAPVALKPGASTVTFTQRSPLSDYSKLLDRLNTPSKDQGPDYQLDQQPFYAYVPPDDGSGKPLGLMVCVDGGRNMQELYPVCNAHRLIFVTPFNGGLPDTVTLGLALDAVYNIERIRPIDPARIYLMGYHWGQVMAFCSGDVFTGDMYFFWAIGYFRRVDGGRHYIPGTFFGPKPEYLRYATTRPQAMGFEDERDENHEAYHNLVMAGMKQDGFERLYKFLVPFGSVPQPADVERMLPVLETSPPTSQPAAAPVAPVNEADHLLKLAQMYIDNQQPDKAREKLNAIIQQYPNDPAAQKAQDLLNQIQGQ